MDFHLVGILPGEYQVEVVLGYRDYLCNCPYDGEHVWMPGIRERAESPWYTFEADSLVTISSVLPEVTGRIEGSVTGAWQEMGLDPPEFSLFTPDSTMIMGRRRILGDEGTFGTDLHLPGPVKVRITHHGVEKWVGGDNFTEATEHQIEAGQTVSGVDLVRGGISMEVVSEEFPSMGDADVRLYDPADMSLVSVAEYINHFSNSHYGIGNLDPGTYLLYLKARSYRPGSVHWRPQWYDRAAEAGLATPVTISAAGDVVDIEVNLEKGGSLTGGYNEDLEDENWRRVVAFRVDDSADSYSDFFFPEHDGVFKIYGLPDGDFKLGEFSTDVDWEVGGPIPVEARWYGGSTWEEATVITIEDAADLTGFVWEISGQE
jgi:hypothetical protein